jgi:hypothetical protein
MTTLADIDVGARAGEIVGGKYRVERVLGAGGMGVVVSAHHIQLDEKVALEFLLPEALGSADAVARFEREARAAVKIKSELVARVIDVGKLPNGAPYIVMEYLEAATSPGGSGCAVRCPWNKPWSSFSRPVSPLPTRTRSASFIGTSSQRSFFDVWRRSLKIDTRTSGSLRWSCCPSPRRARRPTWTACIGPG